MPQLSPAQSSFAPPGALRELLHKPVLGLEETKWAAGGGRQLLLEFLQKSQAAQVSP